MPLFDTRLNHAPRLFHQFTAPYEELETPVSLAYTYHLFPNGACVKPTGFIDATAGPYCVYNTPFRRYNLPMFLSEVMSR